MAAPAGEKLSKPTFRDFYGDVHEDVGSSKGHWVYDKGQRSWRSGPPPKFKLSHRRVGDHLAHDKEWLAGPAARHYRRPATEAREMTIESCPGEDRAIVDVAGRGEKSEEIERKK